MVPGRGVWMLQYVPCDCDGMGLFEAAYAAVSVFCIVFLVQLAEAGKEPT